jgi:hypothetical protein
VLGKIADFHRSIPGSYTEQKGLRNLAHGKRTLVEAKAENAPRVTLLWFAKLHIVRTTRNCALPLSIRA